MPSMVGEWASSCFNNPNFADIRVKGSDGQEFVCLSFVLCLASDVFKCMLSSEMVEGSTRSISIAEVSPEHLEGFLRFLHGGAVHLGPKNLLQFWELAIRFQVPALTAMCEHYARSKLQISTEVWPDLLNRSVVTGFERVTGLCEDFVLHVFQKGLDLHNFEDVEPLGMERIVKAVSTGLASMEAEYYHFVLRLLKWVEFRKGVWNGEDQQDVQGVLEVLDLTALGPHYLCCLCFKGVGADVPQLSSCITAALGYHARFYREPNTKDCRSPLHMVSQTGCWETWKVPRSDWYYISGSGAQGRNGFGTTGGSGAEICGAFYLCKGDQLRMLVGHTCDGGGSSCVIRYRKDQDKCVLLLVAGGGGGGSEKPGENATIQSNVCWGKEFSSSNQSKKDGRSCWGLLIENFMGDGNALIGPCDLCDGGMFTNLQAGGGAGLMGGKASRRGGEGGSSYLNPMAENRSQKICGMFAHIMIHGGMFP